ncbi:hypothetical protein [Desulfofundulus thermosubterraneus]|uniref:Uncharacterized protein n=1 Tax=Desulfofundulus thermosubterraneus DSM 16057 TaxID=1121432 RepID=A0A1M6DI31_9FIRM|nr:hypothetical protein [Desulfofundulus thermosubterraneus]SHI72974.1 hypothetical protein SAMN02745219_00925 [Desulfofundulus thermosubterraneus DSM 16057]
MEKTPLDLGMLSEPLRNLLENIDPTTLDQLRASVDPAVLMGIFGNAIEFIRSLREQDNQALNQLLANMMQLMNHQDKS